MDGILEKAEKGLHIITPTKVSRVAVRGDLWKIFKDAFRIKAAMLSPFPGRYPLAASIAHCQIEGNDPLRFFVTHWHFGWFFGNWAIPQRAVINPEIVSTGTVSNYEREGCMSFPTSDTVKIKRFEVVTLRYQSLLGLVIGRQKVKKFYLMRAYICQHEIDHMNLVTIKDRKAERYKK